MTRPEHRPSVVFMVSFTLLSVVLLVGAMYAYPGGTQWDRGAVGNDFWRNYLCDLARSQALDGRPNPIGSRLAQAGLLSMCLALLAFFWLVAGRVSSRPRCALGIRALGSVASLSALAVAALPADRYSALHGAAILGSGVTGILAAILAVLALALERPAPRQVVLTGAATLVIAILAFVPFVRQYFVDGPGLVVAAVLERLAWLSLLAWMASTAWHAMARRA